MAKLFKKANITDAAINVGVGGAANAAIDLAVESIDAIKSLGDTYVNAGKVVLGVLGGTMVSNKYLRAAANGIATVGVASLVKDHVVPLISGDTTDKTETPSGVPFIGRLRVGQRGFRNAGLRGTGTVAGAGFMQK